MSTEPTVRPAEPDEADRISELVESSLTSSYALSPQDIETILAARFDPGAIGDRIDEETSVVLVAEADGVVAGVAEASIDDGEGEIRWLHVDPERRGAGVGTSLFEAVRSALAADDVTNPRAVVLAANTAAGAFFERFGFEQVDERSTDVDGQELVEYVFAENAGSSGDDEPTPADTEEPEDYPDSATTADGTEIHLGSDPFHGTEGFFVAAFTDEEHSEQYGYYCLHCGSADVSVDEMERARCGECGNTRNPDDYDGAYL